LGEEFGRIGVWEDEVLTTEVVEGEDAVYWGIVESGEWYVLRYRDGAEFT
jgi:hypothetical protein